MADEIPVDLMASASGITYAEALDGVIIREIDGVPIPFAGAELLYRMKKRAGREKDRIDIFSRITLRRTGTPTAGGLEGATLLAGLDIRPVFPIAADCAIVCHDRQPGRT